MTSDSEKAEELIQQLADHAIRHAFKREKKIDETVEYMRKTVSAYKKFNPIGSQEVLIDSDLAITDQFFLAMRHFMDYTEVTDPKKVKEEITKKIQLGIPQERDTTYPEGPNYFEELRTENYLAAIASAQGPRDSMEDEHLTIELPVKKEIFGVQKIELFAVFDGHGGSTCSKYVKDTLPKTLIEEFEKCQTGSDLEIYNTICRAFIKLDKTWRDLPFQQTEHKDPSGTTAAVCLFFKKILWIANVGDSRTVLVAENQPIQLSEEAKATVKKYEKEIYLRGGNIQHGRVVGKWGSLDMARSIGDIDQPSVSALPSLRKFDLKSMKKIEYKIIIACDGLWDVVSPQLAAQVCFHSQNISDSAINLKAIAYDRGTTDNVTVMVIKPLK